MKRPFRGYVSIGAAVAICAFGVGTPVAAQAIGCGPVDLPFRTVHTCIGGEGDITVVFEAGMRDDHRAWDSVLPGLADHAVVMSYDRAGNGMSTPVAGPRTPGRIAGELHELLEHLGLPPRYLLVAHSAGGWHARTFAARYPDQVVGLVLLDHPHELFEARRNALLTDSERAARAEALTLSRADLASSIRREYEGLDASRDTYRHLGDLPLLVVTAETHEWGPRGDAEALEDEWHELQRRLARLSNRGQLVVLSGVGHQIPRERPDYVVARIRELLDQASGIRAR